MRYSLTKFVTAALTCMAILGSPPAAASSIYTVDYTFFTRPFGAFNAITGTITTDGALGPLVPQDIQGWNLTLTATIPPFGGPPVVSNGSSDTGGTLTFTPSSFSATPTELVFDFGPSFTSSLFFDQVGFGFAVGCPVMGECGTILAHRRCWPAWPDLGLRWSSGLGTTASAECLSNSHLVRGLGPDGAEESLLG